MELRALGRSSRTVSRQNVRINCFVRKTDRTPAIVNEYRSLARQYIVCVDAVDGQVVDRPHPS
jgi:hypothetical protein